MNAKHTLLFTLGLASSLVLAQPPASPSEEGVQSEGASGYQSGAETQMPGQTDVQPGTQSEGASDYSSGAETQMPAQSDVQPGTQSEGAPGYSSGAEGQMPSETGTQMQEQSEVQSSGAAADEYDPATRPAPASMTKVEPISEGGFTYMCGGVGSDEAADMKQEARNYDMMLTFAARNGDYLADVNVDIRDAQGKSLLKTTCDAPIMLVDFPESGTYRIHAETGGYSLDRTAQVRAKGRSHVAMVMSWPQQVAEAPEVEPAATSVGDSVGNGSEASDAEKDAEGAEQNNGNMR
ncbi:MAG TPA: hypothetical protein VHK70_05170 [Burkholderiaceae bacterium]|jgi:hypothetical protein|nr:hypothetical protein [Burkholderiaceae bacterium]